MQSIKEKLQAEAEVIVKEKINEYDLASEFGLNGDLELEISGQSARNARALSTTVRTTLDELSEDIKTFLEEYLPPMIFNLLLEEYLRRPVSEETTNEPKTD